jgi:predicted nucleic acid-binding protein
MPAHEFLDTNVLVYAYDVSAPEKRRIGQELVRRAIAGEILISTQVLAEFAATLLHKMAPAARPEQVTNVLDVLAPIKLVVPNGNIVRRAVEAKAAYGLHFYDGMIIAAAEAAGCDRIWSEDLNSGQEYFGIEVMNPFPRRDLA